MMEEKNNGKGKRIAAWIAIILLAGMYIVTFVVALVYPAGAGNLFFACLAATVTIPLLAWIYIWIYGQMTGKKTIADLNLLQDPEHKASKEDSAEKEFTE